MSTKALTKNSVLNDLVALEQFVSKLRNDFEAATYRKNELIESYIVAAAEDLEEGFRQLGREHIKKAHRMLKMSWIQANYARQLFDAETVEHELGEGEYLELTEHQTDWHSKVWNDLNYLENELRQLRIKIKNREAGESL